MDFIRIKTADQREITTRLDLIAAFWDETEVKGHVSLLNGEHFETDGPIARSIRKLIITTGHRTFKAGE